MSKFGMLTVALSFTAFLIGVVGLIIPLWYTSELPEGSKVVHVKRKVYTGLWHTCSQLVYSVSDDYECDVVLGTDNDTHGLKAVQATTIIGLVLLLTVFVIAVVNLLCLENKKLLSRVVAVLAIVAGALLLIGAIIYATEVKNEYNFDVLELNAGFGLTVVTGILALICAIITCLI